MKIINAIVAFFKGLFASTPKPIEPTPVEKPQEPVPTPQPSNEITPDVVRKTFIKNFQKFDGQRETQGKNRSPWIDALNKWIGAKLGSPYCASSCSKALEETEKELGIKIHIYKTAGSQSMFDKTDKKYRVSVPYFGCIGIMVSKSDSGSGHVYACLTAPDANGNMKTFECNTDVAGDRDGDGCMFSKRHIKGDSAKGMRGFIDPGLAFTVLKKPTPTQPKSEIDTKNPDWNLIASKIELDNDPKKLEYLEEIRQDILNGQGKYLSVSAKTGVPWFFIAALHFMECSLRFSRNLMNGQPITQETTIVPKGKGPWSSWEDSAVEALQYDGLAEKGASFWTFGNLLASAEKYNGTGYRTKGILSGYVTSFTNMSEELGGYPEDHDFDPNYKRTRPGVAAILLHLKNKNDIQLKG